jgi:glycosyltransferase involved in cell wall biosynthesis
VKTALVHDWLNQIGGAEDVLETLVEMYPSAPVYTSLYAPKLMPPAYQNWDIRTGFIDKLPFSHRDQRLFLPFYPLLFEQFDFSAYDLVISNKSGFCHGILTDTDTLHVCYCLTPTRYVWRSRQYAEQEGLGSVSRRILPPILAWLRVWDRLAADRVDHFIAISKEVRRRIGKVYRRESTIIYPPVNTSRFQPGDATEDYYLIVGRLVPYRRIDILIEAFNKLGLPLVIGGSGRDKERLEAMAGPTITFLGYVPNEDLPDLMARCKAFMFPGEEDFGIAPIQAMAAGRPVIAYAGGGALDTVIPGRTGVLFERQDAESIVAAVESFDPAMFDARAISAHAAQFDTAQFKRQLGEFVERKMVLRADSRREA